MAVVVENVQFTFERSMFVPINKNCTWTKPTRYFDEFAAFNIHIMLNMFYLKWVNYVSRREAVDQKWNWLHENQLLELTLVSPTNINLSPIIEINYCTVFNKCVILFSFHTKPVYHVRTLNMNISCKMPVVMQICVSLEVSVFCIETVVWTQFPLHKTSTNTTWSHTNVSHSLVNVCVVHSTDSIQRFQLYSVRQPDKSHLQRHSTLFTIHCS